MTKKAVRFHNDQHIDCDSDCPHCNYGPLNDMTGLSTYDTEFEMHMAVEEDPCPRVTPIGRAFAICASGSSLLIFRSER